MAREIFGATPGGEPVYRVSLAGGGLRGRIITLGGALQDLRVEGHEPPLVLGFDRCDAYLNQSHYFGVITGRFANRIASGKFEIDGEHYQADRNFLGKHTLHGGKNGVSYRNWRIESFSEDSVTLGLTDRDGEMGFPGNVEYRCVYRLTPEKYFVVELSAQTDWPTVCSLSHHSYFNFEDGGARNILNHWLKIDADRYLPVDDELIPTGEVRPVAGTRFDFRLKRQLSHDPQALHPNYDHNFCLAESRGVLKKAAWLGAEGSGVEMEMWTSEPGLQLYSGHEIAPGVTGLDGIVYGPYSGLCLESQIWPDAPNRPGFPSALLRPSEVIRQTSEYRFKVD